MPAWCQFLGHWKYLDKSGPLLQKTQRLQQRNQVPWTMCEPEFDKRPNILFTGLRVSFEQPAKQSHLLLPQIAQIQAWQSICPRNAPKGLVRCKWTSLGQCLSCVSMNERWTQDKIMIDYEFWLIIGFYAWVYVDKKLFDWKMANN